MTYDSDEAGKIFVGGLNWETTQENLENHFRRYGEIVDCVVMKNNETGQSRGFGFVTFKDPDVISLVLAAGPHHLDGKTIDPKACLKRGAQRMKDTSDSTKIFIGGLPLNASDDEISKGFEKFGNVVDVTIMFDHEKQRPRGFGFLTFDSPEAVHRACEEHYITINGKQVECKAAQPRNSRPPPRQQQQRTPHQTPTQQQGMPQANQGWYQMYAPQGANSYAAAPGGYPVGYNMYQPVPAAYNYQGNYAAAYQTYAAATPAQYNVQTTSAGTFTTSPATAPYSAPTTNQYGTPSPAAAAPYSGPTSNASYDTETSTSSSNNNNNQYNFSAMGGNYAGNESYYGPTKSRHGGGESGGYKAGGDSQNSSQQLAYHPYAK